MGRWCLDRKNRGEIASDITFVIIIAFDVPIRCDHDFACIAKLEAGG
jgi:hypothetical protein